VNFRGPELQELDGVLSLDEEKFCEKQVKAAMGNADTERVKTLKVSLKGFQLKRFAAKLRFEDATVLRPAEKFASGKVFGKDKLRDSMLKWSKDPIPTSLTKIEKHDVAMAVRMFKDVLGWMGDRSLPYPIMLLNDLIKKCIKFSFLRDEAFCQIIKQLTDNPSEESRRKGWQMMLLCLMCFAPSPRFENYLGVWLINNGTFFVRLSSSQINSLVDVF
jgi:myosin-7